MIYKDQAESLALKACEKFMDNCEINSLSEAKQAAALLNRVSAEINEALYDEILKRKQGDRF